MLVKTESGEIDVDLDAHEAAVKEHFEKKGVLLKPKAEIDAEKETLRTQTISETTSRVSNETHSAWEKAISETLGEQRPDGTKGIDWAKGKVTELKGNQKTEPTEEAKDKEKGPELEDKKRDGEMKDLRKKLEDFERNATEKEKERNQKVVGSAIRASVKALTVAGENDEERATVRESIVTMVNQAYTWQLDEDNELVALDKNGDVVIDTETNRAITFDKLVAKKFSIFLKKATPEGGRVQGTGTGQDDVSKDKVDPSKGVKAATEEEIREKGRALGLVAGSPEWREFITNSKKLSGIQ